MAIAESVVVPQAVVRRRPDSAKKEAGEHEKTEKEEDNEPQRAENAGYETEGWIVSRVGGWLVGYEYVRFV